MARDVSYMAGHKRLLGPPAKTATWQYLFFLLNRRYGLHDVEPAPAQKIWKKLCNFRDSFPQRDRHEAYVVMVRRVEVATRPL